MASFPTSQPPIHLAPGLMLLYGLGSETGIYGTTPANIKFKFATIYGAWNESAGNPLVGRSVLFNEDDVTVVLIYTGQTYTLIEEQKILGQESNTTPP